MHKYLLAGCLSALALTPLAAAMTEQSALPPGEAKPAFMVPLAAKSLLTDVVEITDGQFAAVGDRGHILLSNDGANWQQMPVPLQSNLNSIYFADEKQENSLGLKIIKRKS